MRHTTIRAALQRVADNPQANTDDMLALPVHELVCRTLFEIANNPMTNRRGSGARANVARALIFNRLVGKRMSGSHPATRKNTQIAFANLAGELTE